MINSVHLPYRLQHLCVRYLTTWLPLRVYYSAPKVTLMFGKETKGLPEWLRERYADHCLRIPMRAEARSLNLSNSAAILCYEALRQQNLLGQIDLDL